MTMPGDIALVTLVGTWLDGFGNPAYAPVGSGVASRIVIAPLIPTRFSDLASNTVVMPQRQTVYLNSSGSLPTAPPVQVIATDAVALAGIQGFQYGVAVILYDSTGSQLAPYSFILTAQTGTGPINISAPQYSVTGNAVGVPSP